MDLSELSLYINALLASCDKPRNFYGHDLIATLRYRTNAAQKSAEFVNPSVYLTLCISNEITGTDLVKIRDVFANSRPETNRIGKVLKCLILCEFALNILFFRRKL